MPAPDDGLRPTHVGHVPPWEIDANGHWSNQFYLRAFQSAADEAVPADGPLPPTDTPSVDHVRFFRELRTLETLTVFSARVPDAPHGYGIAHLMRHGVTDALCACAYGTMSAPDLPPLPSDLLERTGPRGLPPGAHGPTDVEALLAAERAAVTHLGVLRPSDLGHRGELLAQAPQARLAEGTGHLWAFLGVRQSDFYDRSLGRAIVEMKVTRHPGATAGQAIRLVSWMAELGERGFQLRHRLDCLTTGRPLADISTLTLIIDLQSRRSAPVPEEIRRKLGGATRDGRVPAADVARS